MKKGGLRYLLIALGVIIVQINTCTVEAGITIREITPHEGSTGGATSLTIYGGDFASSEFNHGAGNEHLGNRVDLLSNLRSYSCPIHKDGTTEVQIVCITPARMAEGDYYVRVWVDGEPVAMDNHCGAWKHWRCRIKIKSSYTPYIRSLLPQSGPADATLTVRGRLFSDRRGSHLAASSNGLSERFLRAYVGGYQCEMLVDPEDDKKFLVALDNEESNEGVFQCQISSRHVGNQNLSFIIEGKYGRSRTELGLLKVSGQNKIYNYQSYAVIDSVSPPSGSLEGGNSIAITGVNFEDTYHPLEVYAGGESCDVTSFTNDQILCSTPSQPTVWDLYPGGRGIEVELWDGSTVSPLEDVSNMTGPTNVTKQEDLDITVTTDDDFVGRVKTFFIPPSNNTYHFKMTSSAQESAVYFSQTQNAADKAVVLSSSGNSASFDLQEGETHYLELLTKGSSKSSVTVGVCVDNTDITSGMTAASISERQRIAVRSTVKKERQIVSVSGMSGGAGRAEVQTVVVTASADALDGATFRLGINSVYTEPMVGNVDSSDMVTALQYLPRMLSDSITVTQASISGGIRYTITFTSNLGDVETLDVKTHPNSRGEELGVTVQTTTQGQTNEGFFSLSIDGISSSPISVTATEKQVADSARGLFSENCPNSVQAPKGMAYFESYETISNSRVIQTEELDTGEIITAFCGKYFTKNPHNLFYGPEGKAIYLSQHKTLCFGHLGGIQSRVFLRVNYKNSQSESKVHGSWYDVEELEASTSWRYLCVNMLDLVSSRLTGASQVFLDYVSVARETDMDVFIDTVYIGSNPTTTDFTGLNEGWTRRRQALPSGHVIMSVNVASSGTDYTIEMTPRECGHDFKLFDIPGGQVKSGSNGASSQQVVYNYGSGEISITVDEEASPPVTGAFDLTANSKTATVPISTKAEDLQAYLQSLGVLGVKVTRGDNCANFDWIVTWTAKGGNQPELQITSKSISGIDATIVVTTLGQGMLCYDPIPAEFLRTVHQTPQVSVLVNKIPSLCRGSCDITWTAAATPTLTSLSPDSGTLSLGTTLTISGSKFSNTPSENSVLIGGVACNVSASTSTSMTCDVGNGARGLADVKVTVIGLGVASHPNTPLTFTYVADLDSISPTSGSTQGGTDLTLSGHGFQSGATVTVDGVNCPVLTNTPSEIVCLTPPQSAPGSGDVGVDVVISQNGESLTSQTFTYSPSQTATISSVTPLSAGVKGGVEIVISGSGFGSSAINSDALMIGNVPVKITSYSDSEVRGEVQGQSPGAYLIQLKTSASGYADTRTNSIGTFSHVLEVTNVYPRLGSLYGGTMVTITGHGFSTVSEENMVTIGEHKCKPETATDTQIVCTIEDTAKVITVTNKGESAEYGSGFSWDRPSFSIHTGDKVQWQWDYDVYQGLKFGVQSTETIVATEYDGIGFTSGSTRSSSGVYEYRFTKAGLFFYWSGYLSEELPITLRGQVEVLEKPSHTGYLSLSVAGFQASYNTASGVGDPSSGSCVGDISAISGCSDPEPIATDSSRFSFSFWQCSSPTVTDVSPVEGTGSDDIVITGNGFTGQTCQNSVFMGDYKFETISSTANTITVRLDPALEVPIGKVLPISVSVSNRGTSLMAIANEFSRSFVALPFISALSPSSGSMLGGTELTLTGGGFRNVSIMLGDYPCEVTSVTYSVTKCVTDADTGTADIVVSTLADNGQFLTATCKVSSGCVFMFTSSKTPVVSSITPQTIQTPDAVFTLSGTGFGSNSADVVISLGSGSCTITSISDTSITCTANEVPAGSQPLKVLVTGKGLAQTNSLVVTVTPKLNTVSPTSGSVYGGTRLTIVGNGFLQGQTTVKLGTVPCVIESVNSGEIVCLTGSSVDGTVALKVISGTPSFTPDLSYSYSAASSPVITSISPSVGVTGDSITVSGSGFGNSPSVSIDDVDCTVTSSSDTSIVCTLGSHSAGIFPIIINVPGVGSSNNDIPFSYRISVTSISPDTGSFAGGQVVQVSGLGFDPVSSEVLICDSVCTLNSDVSQTSSQLTCTTASPSGDDSVLQQCDVMVRVANVNDTLTNGYTFDPNQTPVINSVTPTRGGTAGGTTLTIIGTGFSSTMSDNTVTIDNVICTVTHATSVEIQCTTGASNRTIEAVLDMTVDGKGYANHNNVSYHYVDVWSSPWTWGGNPPPEEGTLVVIREGQTILLDTSTPVLKMILIQGGSLIFDEVDVELQAEIILITDNGLLQIGTEDEPFQHKAIITLHGHQRSKELPIYGTKMIALREGTLDLHGKPIDVTWTHLGSTATAGSTTIELTEAVNWAVGDEIVIATTGDRHSQKESETRTITNISGNKKTLTLSEALTYEHLGVSEVLGGKTIEFRAEVGLLTRNIVVRGSNNPQYHDKIEACEDGFDTGEFSVQTCFQGRFGDEVGSDEFGGHIIAHAPRPSAGLVTVRIEYIEMTYVGQAFRLGRYPIHFHLLGDMTGAYVRGVALHKTFNRLVNIHLTHNVLVEKCVGYNVKGGAFFLEDGAETGNILQYNLAILVKASSSLRNDDITPAGVWVTNPNNTIIGNAIAGGTHFGFWYRMHEHPEGPSFDPNICPKKVPLGVFANNTAHSQGWFGLWIFEDFFPMETGSCSASVPTRARFDGITVWNSEKGIEFVNAGSVQFINAVLVNNKMAGFEQKLVMNAEEFSPNGPGLYDSLIVARSDHLTSSMGSTRGGVVMPYKQGFVVRNVNFVNFDQSGSAAIMFTKIDGTCTIFCGGFNYQTSGLAFTNSPNRGTFRWTHEGVIHDQDGTLSGVVNGRVVTTVDSLPADKCAPLPSFSTNLPASVCQPDVTFIRFGFNEITPESLNYKDAILINSHGNHSVPWALKRITHKKGWVTTLVSGETYTLLFENGEIMENISYSAAYHLQQADDYVTMSQRLQYLPDRVSFVPGVFINETTEPSLTYANNNHGDWKFQSDQNQIQYLVSGKGVTSSPTIYKNVEFDAHRCYYENCEPPPDPNSVPPTTRRPDDFKLWSASATWEGTPEGWGGNLGNGTYGLPMDDDDVIIPEDVWVVADITLPRMKKLYIYGTLELDGDFNVNTNSYKDFTLSAEYIYIVGGRLIVGWPDNPFKGNAEIILRGSHASPRLDVIGGPEVGAKAIGVFGGIDLHGKDVGVAWTTLAASASPGDTTLTLSESTTWKAGDEIVVPSTDYNPWSTETFSIVSVDGVNIQLNDSVKYKHTVFSETVGGQTYHLGCEVGLLTRNVKVIGEDYDNLYTESFGARIIVGFAATAEQSYLGFGRFSNVEFYHTAQEGFIDPYDPRFTISYLDCGTVSVQRPSYVRKCAFHNGFSTAIGVFSTNDLQIEDNVIHHTVGISIDVRGDNVLLKDNMVSLSVSTATYQDRFESLNIRYDGAIDGRHATNLRLIGNVVSGSERVAFRVPGESCDQPSQWVGNIAHSSLIGVGLFPGDGIAGCLKLSGFTVFMCSDFGMYVNTESSGILSDLTLANNILGVFPMVIGPSALEHLTSDKFFTVQDSLIVGTSPSFDCANDRVPKQDFVQISSQGRSHILPNEGKAGIAWASFTQAGNNAPEKPFIGVMAYPAISGIMYSNNITFAHFSNTCGRKDVAIVTNSKNDDLLHPMEARDLVFVQTLEDNKVLNTFPNVGKINPADCVDMDCDGLKKAMITDHDGGLLGAPGVVFSNSAFQWGGDPRRGLGDYRIPKPLLTTTTGSRISVEEKAPNKGIYRDNTCRYVDQWQAYTCAKTTYRMLIIESMDADTETRRLSPVAVLVDKYIDLINGPQDHGWCSGYTCQKRLSTFASVVPTGKEAQVFFTSTSPQSLRLHLLNSGPDESVLLAIWYSNPSRLDVYFNNVFILPTNGYYDNGGNYKLRRVESVELGKPQLNWGSGSNYFDRSTGLMYVLVKGPGPVLIQTSPLIVVVFEASMEVLTIDEFFGENLVNNLVAFLGIDPSKVRLVDTVAEGSVGGRRRRNTDTLRFYIEIGNSPPTTVNDTTNYTLSDSDLKDYETTLVNAALLGSLALNTTMYVVPPLPSPSDPAWTYVVVSEETGTVTLKKIEPITGLSFEVTPTPLYEGKEFSSQPKLKVLDEQGARAEQLGTTSSPWEVSVTLEITAGSQVGASLSGNTTVTFVDGWANFTNLMITFPGTYILKFTVTSPAEAANLTIEHTIDVPKLPLVANIITSLGEILENDTVEIKLDVRDELTYEKIQDLNWRGHTWIVTADLPYPQYYLGTVSGMSSATFDPVASEYSFSDLRFSRYGSYLVKFEFQSNPSDYQFYVLGQVDVVNEKQRNMAREKTVNVEIKINKPYSSVISSEEDKQYFAVYIGNYFREEYPNVIITNVEVKPGSILIVLTVSGNTTMVDSMVKSACDLADEGKSFTFNGVSLELAGHLKVDGTQRYGETCGAVTREKVKDTLSDGVIAAIVVVSVLFVIIIVAIIYWKVKIKPKNKTVDDYDNHWTKTHKLGSIQTTLFKENTFDSLRSRELYPATPRPPSDTTIPSATAVRPFTAEKDNKNK